MGPQSIQLAPLRVVLLALFAAAWMPLSSTAPAAAPAAAPAPAAPTLPAASGQQQQPKEQQAPKYSSVFAAMMKESDLLFLKNTYLNTTQELRTGDAMKYFPDLLNRVTDTATKGTYFWPVNAAWDDLSRQLCMSQEEIQNMITGIAPMAANYMKLVIVPDKTVMSDEFKDGMRLQTMQTTNNFELMLKKMPSRDGGAPKWVLPGVALNGSDVTIVRTNITAGNAVIHYTDAHIVDEVQRQYWKNQGEIACNKSRNQPLPAGSGSSSSSSSSSMTPGLVAAIVVPCVIAAALIVGQHALF